MFFCFFLFFRFFSFFNFIIFVIIFVNCKLFLFYPEHTHATRASPSTLSYHKQDSQRVVIGHAKQLSSYSILHTVQ